MTEEHDSYWQDDLAIGESSLRQVIQTLAPTLRAHGWHVTTMLAERLV